MDVSSCRNSAVTADQLNADQRGGGRASPLSIVDMLRHGPSKLQSPRAPAMRETVASRSPSWSTTRSACRWRSPPCLPAGWSWPACRS